ncbi:MAG: hypothetical protein JWL83_3324 [Actinomycetia bacterium]|nr:hypothetical protein [Actinomycetes bacterium]
MSSAPSIQGIRSRPTRRISFEWWWVLSAALFVVALLIAAPEMRTGGFVSHVDVANASEFAVEVQVSAPNHDGWMALGTAVNGTSTSFREVYDQGAAWTFHYNAQGLRADVQMSRDDLARAGWKVQVPQALAERLRAAAAAATPKVVGI